MNENLSAVIDIQFQYAFSRDGHKRIPIGVTVSEGEDLLYSSAIYASDKIYDIPVQMREACRNAPCIASVREQLKGFDVPVMI